MTPERGKNSPEFGSGRGRAGVRGRALTLRDNCRAGPGKLLGETGRRGRRMRRPVSRYRQHRRGNQVCNLSTRAGTLCAGDMSKISMPRCDATTAIDVERTAELDVISTGLLGLRRLPRRLQPSGNLVLSPLCCLLSTGKTCTLSPTIFLVERIFKIP